MSHPDVVSRVGPVHWCLCASPAYLRETRPIQLPEQLVQQALIAPASLGRTFDLVLNAGSHVCSISVTPRLQSGDYPFLVQAVLGGMGIALLPRYAVWRQLRDGVLVELLSEYRTRGVGDSLYVMASAGRYPSLAAQTLIEFMVRHLLQRMPDWDPGHDSSLGTLSSIGRESEAGKADRLDWLP